MQGLYVHIPFCRSKCAYCDFFSTPRAVDVSSFIEAVGAEWLLRRGELQSLPQTVYIGGGTPSVLSPESLSHLFSLLPVQAPLREFTIEVNPDDVSPSLVSFLSSTRVNRVSMGVQSLVDSELAAVGRRHDAATAVRAFSMLSDAGFSNVTLDLIYGLPSQTLRSWTYSLHRLLDLRPAHFSAYMLSYELGTRLYAMRLAGKISETDDDTLRRMYEILCDSAARAGYEHYEISNFALPGCRSVHNSNYWNFSPYLGLGPSAHSFTGGIRRFNPSDIRGYCTSLLAGRTVCVVDEESDVDRLNDRIMVALRTSDGLDLSILSPEDSQGILSRSRLLPPGSLVVDGSRIRIPESRFLVSDAIIRTLLADS